MARPRRIPMDTPPGVVKRSSPYWAQGRYVDMDKVRFRDGLAEKEGGCIRFLTERVNGVCRGLHSYLDANGTRYLALGTHTRLYAHFSGTLNNITPLAGSGTLTDPFTMTSGSRTIEVEHVGHGLGDGATAIFGNGAPVGGLYVQGAYTVTVIDNDHYQIDHVAAASATQTGGGTVNYAYEIEIGRRDNIDGFGYGVGPYGTSTYGTPRTGSGLLLLCRTWTIDHRDDDLIATPYGGKIYKWSPGDQRAAVLTNAPVDCIGSFVTEDGHIVALGANGNPLDLAWCDPDIDTLWTPALDNEAGLRTLQGSGRLISGRKLARGINLLWSDAEAYLMRYVPESSTIFDIQRLGSGHGLAGPNAVTELNGVPYWMSPDGAFYRFVGSVQRIDDGDITEIVAGTPTTPANNQRQMRKAFAFRSARNAEVGFLYPSAGSLELDRLARYSPEGGFWVPGTWERTAWLDSDELGVPIAVGADGTVYQHETGVDNDGQPMRAHLLRAPDELDEGDTLMDIIGIIPDFAEQRGNLTLTLLTAEYPRATPVRESPQVVSPRTLEVEPRASGRHVGFELVSDEIGGFFRMGKMKLRVARGGNR